MDKAKRTRRNTLKAIGPAGIAALAGCFGGSDSERVGGSHGTGTTTSGGDAEEGVRATFEPPGSYPQIHRGTDRRAESSPHTNSGVHDPPMPATNRAYMTATAPTTARPATA